MLQLSILKFLKELKKNNNKSWFDENRKSYEIAKSDFSVAVDKMITGIATFDQSIENLKAKDCMFRINRDIRFSKDKSPYKTNMGAYFNSGGKKINNAGYYFHFAPGASFAAGGFYVPEPPELSKIRQEIDYNFDEWKKIVETRSFKKYFPEGVNGTESLTRPPKGYDENNPAINYLKMKSFIVSHAFTDAELLDKSVIKEIIKMFELMKPMIDFLNKSIE
jgi:uncharacterized protein (TIGR02453 family)